MTVILGFIVFGHSPPRPCGFKYFSRIKTAHRPFRPMRYFGGGGGIRTHKGLSAQRFSSSATTHPPSVLKNGTVHGCWGEAVWLLRPVPSSSTAYRLVSLPKGLQA